MKVYEFSAFPNPYRVRIALAEKGLTKQVEFVQINVPKGEHRQAAFLAKNPAGQVPILELDDGTIIAECAAITEYLDHLTGEPVLTGQTPKERAVIHMTQRRIEANLLDAATTYFHHATAGLGPEIEDDQNKDWGEKQKERAIATLAQLNRKLAQQPYMAGDRFSVADITAMAALAFVGAINVAPAEDATHLKAWHELVNARPSAQA